MKVRETRNKKIS